MIIHYFKIALRNIFKDRIYSLLNLIGLSVAIACCFLLIFWIKFELSFEDCHSKAGRIYKVLEVEKRTDGIHKSDWIRPGIARQLKETFPEIESSTIVHHEWLSFVYENKEGIMADYTTTTPDYLDLFSYEYIEGSKDAVLKNKGVILSEETAGKFFGKESAIGKTVHFGNNFLKCNVQAVVRIPQNTHLKFDILNPAERTDYGVHYILVRENARFSNSRFLSEKLFSSFLR